MVLVAMVYANNFLDARLAENEFATNKQFMLTTSLQIDDIAWTIGRAQTVRYSSRYGQVDFEPGVLTYTLQVHYEGKDPETFTWDTGAVMFNMPVDKFTMGNGYFEQTFPASDWSFIQSGPSAPVSHVFAIEKLNIEAGSYNRVVVVPSIRMMPDANIDSQTYVRLYLPLLMSGESLHRSQSVTLVGKNVTQYVFKDVTQVQVSVSYPPLQESRGFDADFFKFNPDTIILDESSVPPLPSGSIVELYVGEVTVSLGLHA